MALTILVYSLLALVVTSRPIVPIQNLTDDDPTALRNVAQAIVVSSDIPDALFHNSRHVHVRITSTEDQNAYLHLLDDTAAKTISLPVNEAPANGKKKTHEILGNSKIDNLNGVEAPPIKNVLSAISVELGGEPLPLDDIPAEGDLSGNDSFNTSFTMSPPLLVLIISCIIALLGVLCVGVTLYTARYLRSKVLASREALEMLPRFGKGNGEVGLLADCHEAESLPNQDGITTGLPRDIFAGGNTAPLGLGKPEEAVLDVEKLVDLPDPDINESHENSTSEHAVDPLDDPVQLLQYPVLTCEYPSPSEDGAMPTPFGDNPWLSEAEVEEEKLQASHDVGDVGLVLVDNDSYRSDELSSPADSSPGQLYADPDLMPLPISVPPATSGSPISAPSSPTHRPIQMSERSQTSSPISRPAWSLRASDAPALGVPSNTRSKTNSPRPSPLALSVPLPLSHSPTSTSSPYVGPVGLSTATLEVEPARHRAYRSQVPEFDIALAMQLRPGLGVGADPAWMVRFLMAMFGWLTVLLTGKRPMTVKRMTTGNE